MLLRPEVAHSLRAARQDLHRFQGFVLLRVCVQAGLPLRCVPAVAWKVGEDEDGYTWAVVTCNCGAKTGIYAAAEPAPCDGCDRWFFYDTREVWVLNSPLDQRTD